jgi:hypothetical protein
MAVFTRINGDAYGVVNVDAGRVAPLANANVINTGIAAPLTFYKVTFTNGNLAAELTTGGAVETTLRVLSGNATILAYQVDATTPTSNLSVVTERSSWTDSGLSTMLTNLGNIGATGAATVAAASSSAGFKLF